MASNPVAPTRVVGTPIVDNTKTDVSQFVDSQQILDLPITTESITGSPPPPIVRLALGDIMGSVVEHFVVPNQAKLAKQNPLTMNS
jgi:hypothetical protein